MTASPTLELAMMKALGADEGPEDWRGVLDAVHDDLRLVAEFAAGSENSSMHTPEAHVLGTTLLRFSDRLEVVITILDAPEARQAPPPKPHEKSN